MQLTEHRPDHSYFVHSLQDEAIRIVDQAWSESLLLTPDRAPQPWSVETVEGLTEAALEPVFDYRPDVVLLATGRSLRFPSSAVQRAFHSRHVGLEVMTLKSAARTFNVLASEERRVLAALIWQPAA